MDGQVVFQSDTKHKIELTPILLLSVKHLQHGGLLIFAEHIQAHTPTHSLTHMLLICFYELALNSAQLQRLT